MLRIAGVGRPHLTRAAAQIVPSGVTALDLWAFVLPAVSFAEITIIGRLILTEALLLAMLPWLWRAPDRPSLPRWFLVVWAGWLLGQIVTDLVVGSSFRDFARGWAGIIFTLTNFAGILILVAPARRARIFALGLAAGGLLGYVFAPNPNAAVDPWKWAFAGPLALVVAAGVSGRWADQHRWLAIAAFGALGLVNLLLGYRSLAGVLVLTAAYLALAAASGRLRLPRSRLQAVVGVLFLFAVGLAVVGLYSVAASNGLLGQQAQARYFDQAGALGVLLGGRSEALVSTQAIIDSPILGHGSWAKDPFYARLLADRQTALGYELTPDYVGNDLIPAHSYFMQGWVWAGVLGAAFWLAIGGVTLWLLARLYAFRVAASPLIVFSAIFLLWSIAFSPYGHSARITAPYAIAVVLLGFRLMRDGHEEPSPVRGGVGRVPRVEAPAAAATGGARISVVIPSFNSGRYLRVALTSALEQVPPPHEVLVQDGGSTDETLDILRSFGDRVKWLSEPDRGQSDALNKAVARSTGDVVIWLNADDLLLPGSLAAATEAFEANPELGFAYGDFDIIGSNGELLRTYRSSPYSWKRVFSHGCYIFSGSLFVKKEALLAIGGFDIGLRACMDLDLMLRLNRAGPSVHLGRPIGELRMHGTNKSSTIRSAFFRESLEVRRRHAGRSLSLWLIALWSTAVQGVGLATASLRYSPWWPRHGRGKTL